MSDEQRTAAEQQTAAKLNAPGFLGAEAWSDFVRDSGLSAREAQVAAGILEGMSAKGIARTLGISFHTVNTHTKRLFRKVEISRRSELIPLVLRFLERSRLKGEQWGA